MLGTIDKPAPPSAIKSSITDLIDLHEQRRRVTLNLVASENLMSPAALKALASDFAHRYALPGNDERPKEIWEYPNQDISRQIEARGRALACSLFHGNWADLRPLSGNNIAGLLLSTLVASGEGALSVPATAGGHFATPPICDRHGVDRRDLPYDAATGRVSLAACAALAREFSPRFIYLDASMILFPYPVAELREIFGDDCIIAYDASHCFGIIAGGSFQAPLLEGADLIVGSTHKSMFGPQKGLIVARDAGAIAATLKDAITPLFVSNSHVHHVAALGVALEELEVFGRDYARQVVVNAQALGEALFADGIDVLFPEQRFTNCHQLLCDLRGVEGSAALSALQRCGLHVNAVNLPFRGSPGLRLGVAELTRRGFGVDAITEVAGCIADVLHQRAPEERVAARVMDLSRAHPGLAFAFAD